MKYIGTKEIQTERLILRRIVKNDAEKMFANWTSRPIVSRYTRWNAHKTLADTKEYVNYKTDRYDNVAYCYDWIVTLKSTGEPIGEIEAIEILLMDNAVEVGYCYGDDFWGKGYATEALKAFISFMFDNVGVDKIFADHISTNPASGKVMQKAGMQFDAILKGYLIDKNTGKREDKVCYSIDRQ